MSINREVADSLRTVRELQKPNRPTTPEVSHFRENFQNAFAQSMVGGFQRYLHDSASEYESRRQQIAAISNSGEEFIKRVDNELNPQYKLESLLSPAQRRVMRGNEGVAQMIDARVMNETRNLDAGTTINKIVNLRDNYTDFAQFKEAAQQEHDNYINQWGAPPPAFEANYKRALQDAQNSYANGYISDKIKNWVASTTREFTMNGDFSPEAVTGFLDGQVLPAIESIDSEQYKYLYNKSLENILMNVQTKEQGAAILEAVSDRLTPNEKRQYQGIADQSVRIEAMRREQTLNALENYISEQHSLGLPVDEGMIPSQKALEDNQKVRDNDFRRMSPEQLEQREDAGSDLVQSMITRFRNDAKNFPKFVKDRFPGEELAPLTPILLDDKGRPMNLETAVESARKRMAVGDMIKTMYGGTAAFDDGYWGPDKVLSYTQAFNQMSSEDKLKTGAQLMGIASTPEQKKMIGKLLGDKPLQDALVMAENPPLIPGGTAQLYKAYIHYDTLRKENNAEFHSKTQWAKELLSAPASPGGKRMLTGWMSGELKGTVEWMMVGNSMGATDRRSFVDGANNQIYFYAREGRFSMFPGKFHTPMEATEISFDEYNIFKGMDGAQGVTLANYISQWREPEAFRTGGVTLSKGDYMALRQQVDSYKMSNGKTPQEMLFYNPRMTFVNHNDSFHQFKIVEIDKTNMMHDVLDDNGNPLVFDIKGKQNIYPKIPLKQRVEKTIVDEKNKFKEQIKDLKKRF